MSHLGRGRVEVNLMGDWREYSHGFTWGLMLGTVSMSGVMGALVWRYSDGAYFRAINGRLKVLPTAKVEAAVAKKLTREVD